MSSYLDRGGALRLVVAALVVAAAAWPAAGAASPLRAGSNAQTFVDPAGDSGNAADVTTVSVSNDDTGQITFTIAVPNRPTLSGTDFIGIDMETNGDPNDGSGGYDVFVATDSDGTRMYSLAGGGFERIDSPTVSSGFANGVLTLSFNKSDVGDSAQIAFRVWTDTDNTFPEDAPDDGLWTYQVAIGAPVLPPPTVKLSESKPLVSVAAAGKRVTVSAVVLNNGSGVKGAVACTARIGSKPLGGARRSATATGKTTCSWGLPAGAHGKRLTGTIGAAYGGKRISRPFAATVR